MFWLTISISLNNPSVNNYFPINLGHIPHDHDHE